MSEGFDGLLGQLEDGDEYEDKPPHGPPNEFPSLTDKEIEELQERNESSGAERSFHYTELLEDHEPKEISYPSAEDLDDAHIFGVDGSNQRTGPAAFKAILAKASLVEFIYSGSKKEKYHKIHTDSCSGCFISESGIFKETKNLFGKKVETGEEAPDDFLDKVRDYDHDQPFLLEANDSTGNPENEAMGWAVKLQQLLELEMLGDVDDKPGVTIRDGPLLSTSASPDDTKRALRRNVKHWENQVLTSVSKRVDNSTMLIEVLKENKKAREAWFPGQDLYKEDIERISGDSSVLDKIIEPGERTPFIEAVNLQRSNMIENNHDLAPVACYYLTRNRPHEYVKIEVPYFMWKRPRYDIEKALQLVVWQLELGSDVPLVQSWADEACQITDQKRVVRDKIKLKLEEKGLDVLGDWE